MSTKIRLLCVAIVLLLVPLNLSVLMSQTIAQNGDSISVLAWNSDGSLLATARANGTISITDVVNNIVTDYDLEPTPATILDMQWAPSGSRLAVSKHRLRVKILDYANGQLSVVADFGADLNAVLRVQWNADGTKLMTMGSLGAGDNATHHIRIWDAQTLLPIASYDDNYALVDAAWHPLDPDLILFTDVEDLAAPRIGLWNANAGEIVWLLDQPDRGYIKITWNMDGTSFASSGIENESATVYIHDPATGQVTNSIPSDASVVGDIALGRDGLLAIADLQSIEVWDLTSLQPVDTITSISGFVTAIAWNDTGRLAYGAGADVIVTNTYTLSCDTTIPSPTN